MKKKLSLILITMSLVIAMWAPMVFAADLDTPIDDPVIEEYQYISSVKSKLLITGGTANASVVVKDSNNDTTKTEVTMYLQKQSGKSWSNVATWSKTAKSGNLYLSGSKDISKGKYRVKSVVKAYKGKKSESTTDTSSTVTYK